MQQDVAKVLFDRHAIARRVEALARQITADLTDEARQSGRGGDAALEITLVPILSGSFMFTADLIRHLPMRLQIHMLAISSYPGTATQSRGARLQRDLTNLPETLAGRHVLLIDDILDSGGTLRMAIDLLQSRQPTSLRTCVLLRKDRPEARSIAIDYVAFESPDAFVVGYGLDYDGYYRNLPEIVTLRPEVYGGA